MDLGDQKSRGGRGGIIPLASRIDHTRGLARSPCQARWTPDPLAVLYDLFFYPKEQSDKGRSAEILYERPAAEERTEDARLQSTAKPSWT